MSFEQSRRDFLRLAGKTMLGAAALTAVPAVVSAEDKAPEAPAWPWTWHNLDVAEVQAKTFENFPVNGGCGGGVSSGIMDLLAEKHGYPYNHFPAKMMALAGGGYGRKNLCGALGGAFAVLGMFCEPADANALRNELYAWYETTAFPVYQPADQPAHEFHSVSGSEICKQSVSNWMALAGMDIDKDFGNPARIMRCRCLSADVAGKTVELLNAKFGAAAPVEEAAPALAANEYIGEGKGNNGTVKVKVTMDGDKIAKIEVLEHVEDGWAFDKAYPAVTDAMIAANSAEVDAVAGATNSSNGLIAAVKDALSKVGK